MNSNNAKPSVSEVYNQHHVGNRPSGHVVNEDARAKTLGGWAGRDQRQLDVGCRDGRLTQYFARTNTVTGIDIDPGAVEKARAAGIDALVCNLNEPLPFDTASFEVISACEVLEHLPYWGISVREMRRVIKPRGLLIGSVPISYHLVDRWRVLRGKSLLSAKDPTHVRFFNIDQFAKDLRQHGFEMNAFEVLEGDGAIRSRFPRLFARNIAFRAVAV